MEGNAKLGTFLVEEDRKRMDAETVVTPSIKGSCKRQDPTLRANCAVVIER